MGSMSPSKTPFWAERRETGEEEAARFRGFIRQELCSQPAQPLWAGLVPEGGDREASMDINLCPSISLCPNWNEKGTPFDF